MHPTGEVEETPTGKVINPDESVNWFVCHKETLFPTREEQNPGCTEATSGFISCSTALFSISPKFPITPLDFFHDHKLPT